MLQTDVVLRNLTRPLEATGTPLERVVNTKGFPTDLTLFYTVR